MQGHGRGLGDLAVRRPAERLGDPVRSGLVGLASLPSGVPPRQRCLPGRRVDGAVVDDLNPGREQCVEFLQGRDRGPGAGRVRGPGGRGPVPDGRAGRGAGDGDLGQELRGHGVEEPFDLSTALGPVGPGMDQPDPEPGADPRQRRIHEGGAVVHVDGLGYPVGLQGWAQRCGQPDGVLGERPAARGHQSRMVVEEREQVRLAAADPEPVQPVADPDLVRAGRLEPAGRLGRAARREVEGAEVAQQRRLRRRIAQCLGHDPGDLRRGPGRPLALQRRRQRQDLRRGDRALGPVLGLEPVEPVAAPDADPPVDRVLGHEYRLTVGAPMLGHRQRPDHRAALAACHRVVRGLADQLVTEQRDPLGPVLAGPGPALGHCAITHQGTFLTRMSVIADPKAPPHVAWRRDNDRGTAPCGPRANSCCGP